MVKKKAPIAIDSVDALEMQRKVDRSDRVVKPGAGIKAYEFDISEIKDNPLPQTTELPQDAATPSKAETPKPASASKVNKTTPKEKSVGRTASSGTEDTDTTPQKLAEDVEEAPKDSSKPQALSVPLRLQEYTMYNEIIEKINALGPPKKVAGTDVQRASIHLLYKMTPEKILKAHLQLMMTVGAPTENDDKRALSVLLQPRERKMFSKIIDKINALGLSKKIKGTDIQRASIYLLYKMKPERIVKAHYQSLMP